MREDAKERRRNGEAMSESGARVGDNVALSTFTLELRPSKPTASRAPSPVWTATLLTWPASRAWTTACTRACFAPCASPGNESGLLVLLRPRRAGDFGVAFGCVFRVPTGGLACYFG